MIMIGVWIIGVEEAHRLRFIVSWISRIEEKLSDKKTQLSVATLWSSIMIGANLNIIACVSRLYLRSLLRPAATQAMVRPSLCRIIMTEPDSWRWRCALSVFSRISIKLAR